MQSMERWRNMSRKKSKLKILIVKELKELSKERIVLFGLLLGPLIMYAVMGGLAGAAAGKVVEQAAKPPKVAILFEGGEPGNITKALAQALNATIYTGISVDDLLNEGYNSILLLNNSFEENITKGIPASITLIYKPESIGFVELSKPQGIAGAVSSIVLQVVADYLKQYMPDISAGFLSNPVRTNIEYYYKGELLSADQLQGLVMGVSLAIPLAVLMTAVSATQVAAISFGLEKEAKTLEKLFTLPVSRRSLLVSKLAAVTVLAIGGVFSYMAGLYIYLKMVERGFAVAAAEQTGEEATLGFTITLPTSTIIILGIGLALTLYVSIVIGFIVGSQASDVRGSQLAASYISFALAIPLFMMFFGVDLAQLSTGVKILLAFDPYAVLSMIATSSITGDHQMVLTGFGILIAQGIFWTLIATRLLSSEALITGHPLIMKLKKRMTRSR